MKTIFTATILFLALLSGCTSESTFIKNDIAISSDAERIAYNVYGTGSTALVFIHGWSCDSRYWREQIATFSKEYTVITMDLAGHGHSSSNRTEYTIESFAEDVQAVIKKENIGKAILIGHSFGGSVIAESAERMPQIVLAIIGIDTFHNAEEKVSQEAIDQMLQPFNDDFVAAAQGFVASMFPEGADKDLVSWIKEDMSSAPDSIAINAISNYLQRFVSGETSQAFKNVHVPVLSINARLWPTDEEANRKHIEDYRPFYIEGSGHFPMMEKPEEFNRILKEALTSIEAK